jgi:adenylate kinase
VADILLLGPQGAGKGTQGRMIAAEYGIPHIATGDMLREAMAADSELGRRIRPIYDAGRLVPDDLMIALIRERLGAEDAQKGFVLDGFPRTMPQAEALEEMLREIGRELDVVFEFQLDDALGRERMQKRAADEGRTDDTPEVIERRLRLYHEETEPLVEYYRTRGNLVGIHADRPIEAVFAEIQQAVEQASSRRRSGREAAGPRRRSTWLG